MNRRRVLSLTAAACILPGATMADPKITWRGFALGAEVTLTLRAPKPQADAAIAAARAQMLAVENAFSLYRPTSELVRLNTTGRLEPSDLFLQLMDRIDAAHAATGGLFDPTVQGIWAAIAQGKTPDRGTIGWIRLRRDDSGIAMDRGQSLTFNGIAQGFATDLVRTTLRAQGLTDILVNMGEFGALGGPWHLGIGDPTHGLVGRTTLRDGAIATTSAAPHLIGPAGQTAQHATVAVEADNATDADALSTALLFMNRDRIRRDRSGFGARKIHLIDRNGYRVTL